MSREGRNQVGRSPDSRHSMHSYILTYYRLGLRKLLIPLGSHRGPFVSAPRGSPPRGGWVGGGGGGGGRFEHPRLVEMVPSCSVAFYDTRSESSAISLLPHSRRGNEDQNARR